MNALKRVGRRKSAERERNLSAAVEHFCGAMLTEFQASTTPSIEPDALNFPGNFIQYFRSGELH